MSIVSYAQNFEDVMLWRALGNIPNGFYVDVGAHDPVNGSVTKAFYDAGWSGINVEPILDPYKALCQERTRDVNLQMCLGSLKGDVEIYDVAPSGLATVDSKIAHAYQEKGYLVNSHIVEIETLANVFEKYVANEVHFLKIDVEGFEKEVLLGANFEKIQPWIIVVEATLPNTNIENHDEWEYILTSHGYLPAYFDGLNRFYVSKNKSDLLKYFKVPPNYFDHFSLSETCFFCRDIKLSFEEKLHSAEEKLHSAEEKLHSAEEKLHSAEEKLHNMDREISNLLNSKTWRYTKPVRLLLSFLKNNINFARVRSKYLIHSIIYKTLMLAFPMGSYRQKVAAKLLYKLPYLRKVLNMLLYRKPNNRLTNNLDNLTTRAIEIYEDLRVRVRK